MRIFGRETSKTHGRLAVVCEEILSSTASSENDRACAWNLLHDQRVVEDWGEAWYLRYGQPVSPAAVRNAFTRYLADFREHYLDRYADLESRAGSAIPAGAADAPASGDLLVHVFDLWSPGSRLIWELGVMRELGELRGIAHLDPNANQPPPAIQRALGNANPAAQRPWMDSFFQAQEEYLNEADNRRRRGHVHTTLSPFWASLWKPWRERAGPAAEDWCASVGLSKDPSTAQSWIAVVRYPVSTARRLFRPTQLEAGGFGRHFPTPPGCTANQGGRVVEGRPRIFEQVGHTPLPEYLHAPVPLSVQHWKDAGFPVLPCRDYVGKPVDLERDRSAHWFGLGREFSGVNAWMTKANGL